MQKGAKASGWVFVCLVKSCSLSTFGADTLTEVSNVLSITVSATLWVESCCTTKLCFVDLVLFWGLWFVDSIVECCRCFLVAWWSSRFLWLKLLGICSLSVYRSVGIRDSIHKKMVLKKTNLLRLKVVLLLTTSSCRNVYVLTLCTHTLLSDLTEGWSQT